MDALLRFAHKGLEGQGDEFFRGESTREEQDDARLQVIDDASRANRGALRSSSSHELSAEHYEAISDEEDGDGKKKGNIIDQRTTFYTDSARALQEKQLAIREHVQNAISALAADKKAPVLNDCADQKARGVYTNCCEQRLLLAQSWLGDGDGDGAPAAATDGVVAAALHGALAAATSAVADAMVEPAALGPAMALAVEPAALGQAKPLRRTVGKHPAPSSPSAGAAEQPALIEVAVEPMTEVVGGAVDGSPHVVAAPAVRVAPKAEASFAILLSSMRPDEHSLNPRFCSLLLDFPGCQEKLDEVQSEHNCDLLSHPLWSLSWPGRCSKSHL